MGRIPTLVDGHTPAHESAATVAPFRAGGRCNEMLVEFAKPEFPNTFNPMKLFEKSVGMMLAKTDI